MSDFTSSLAKRDERDERKDASTEKGFSRTPTVINPETDFWTPRIELLLTHSAALHHIFRQRRFTNVNTEQKRAFLRLNEMHA